MNGVPVLVSLMLIIMILGYVDVNDHNKFQEEHFGNDDDKALKN